MQVIDKFTIKKYKSLTLFYELRNDYDRHVVSGM